MENEVMPSTPSPLRYPGGKTKFYAYVKEILRCNDLIGQTYVEPFAGGAGLAIKLLLNNDVSKIVINDYDPAIYSIWKCILYHTDDFCNLIENVNVTPSEWKRQRNIYLQEDADELDLGFATFFLNRTNVSGIINGGMIGGKKQLGSYRLDARFNKSSLLKKIEAISSQKDKICLLNLDAKKLLQSSRLKRSKRMFVNIDPPYVQKGAQLYENSFTEQDHKDLSKIISSYHQNWMVTYDVCPLVANLYKQYRYSYLDMLYTVKSCKKAREFVFFSDTLTIPHQIDLQEPAT